MSRNGRSGTSIGVLVTLVVIAAVLCGVLITVMYMDSHGMIGGDKSGSEIQDADNGDTGAESGEGDRDDIYVRLKNAQSENSDVYAWLSIPEAGIDEPVLQNGEDLNFYSDHNIAKQMDENGAVFTQMFNSRDFSDNVTVVYGHNGNNEKGFSNLKVFSDPEYFKSFPYIFVYTDGKILKYRTFAAYETDDKLIIVFYGTQNEEMYGLYLSNIESYAGMNANFNKDIWPDKSDRILTLSTGVEGKDDRRFLVQAKLVEEQTEGAEQ